MAYGEWLVLNSRGTAMPSDTRTTVYLKPNVYRALKVKAATTDRSVSDLVNAAVLESLKEDAVDLEAFDRPRQRTVPSVREGA